MKRFRAPSAKPGELKIRWGKLPGDNPDMVFCWGDGTSKRDSNLLHWVLASTRCHVGTNGVEYLPSLFKELESRGYDLTTLRFSIQKKGSAA